MSGRQSKKTRRANKTVVEMPTLDIEYWDYDNGLIGARFPGVPGDIMADNPHHAATMLAWLVESIKGVEEKAQESGSGLTRRMDDLKMQGQWVDDEFCIRFWDKPGFMVSFKAQDELKAWLAHLINLGRTIAQPQTVKTSD